MEQPCTVTSQCNPCLPSFFSEEESSGPCEPCSQCGVGLYALHPCNATSDVFCESCLGPNAHPSISGFLDSCLQFLHATDNASVNYEHPAAVDEQSDDEIPVSQTKVGSLRSPVRVSVMVASDSQGQNDKPVKQDSEDSTRAKGQWMNTMMGDDLPPLPYDSDIMLPSSDAGSLLDLFFDYDDLRRDIKSKINPQPSQPNDADETQSKAPELDHATESKSSFESIINTNTPESNAPTSNPSTESNSSLESKPVKDEKKEMQDSKVSFNKTGETQIPLNDEKVKDTLDKQDKKPDDRYDPDIYIKEKYSKFEDLYQYMNDQATVNDTDYDAHKPEHSEEKTNEKELDGIISKNEGTTFDSDVPAVSSKEDTTQDKLEHKSEEADITDDVPEDSIKENEDERVITDTSDRVITDTSATAAPHNPTDITEKKLLADHNDAEVPNTNVDLDAKHLVTDSTSKAEEIHKKENSGYTASYLDTEINPEDYFPNDLEPEESYKNQSEGIESTTVYEDAGSANHADSSSVSQGPVISESHKQQPKVGQSVADSKSK